MSLLQPTVLVAKRPDHIAVVTLNRPESRNAVNVALTESLQVVTQELETDDNVWAVVLTGAGGQAFSSGADLKEVSRGHLADLIFGEHGFAGFVHAPRYKPWIAAVEGYALAGGCELALACDLIVATEGGHFGLPEVKRGLVPSAGGAYRLPRSLPRAVALECIITGSSLTSERAYELGMINRLAPKGKALDVAIQLAGLVTTNAPIAVRETLGIARMAYDLDDETLRRMSDEAQRRVMTSEDFLEGPRAFVEKRAPDWKGR